MVVEVFPRGGYFYEAYLVGADGERLIWDMCLRGKADRVLNLYKSIVFCNAKYLTGFLKDIYSSVILAGGKGHRDEISTYVREGYEPRTDSIRMAQNLANVIKNEFPYSLNERWITDNWKRLVSGVCDNTCVMGEKYRSGNLITKLGYPTIEAKMVQECMGCLENYIIQIDTRKTDYNPFIKAAITHFYLRYVHPFCDGNGKMARLLEKKVLFDCGLSGIVNVPIWSRIFDKKDKYDGAFIAGCKVIECEDRNLLDMSAFIEYMLDMYEKALLDVKKGIKNRYYEKAVEYMGRVGMVTIKMLKDELGVNDYGIVRKCLNELYYMGVVGRKDDGRLHKYFLV